MRPRNLLSVCLIIASQPAFAGIWSPDTDRILGDPAYLPLAGQVFGEASYSYTEGQSQRKSETQIPFFSDQPTTFSNKSDSNNFLPSLSYGLTDDLLVSADLGFGNTRTSQTYTIQYYTFFGAVRHGGLLPFPIGPITFPMPRVVTVHVDDHARSIGANDPGFGLTWRAIDERRAPVNVDLTVSYAPDIFQAHGSGYETTGTQAFGGQRASASVAVSRELRLLTVAAFGTFTYNGRSDLGSGSIVDRSGAHPAYGGGVQSQIRLLPFLALNTGASVSQTARFDDVTISTFDGATYRGSETIRPALAIEPYAGLVFPILGPRMVGEVLYEHVSYGKLRQFDAFGDASESFNHASSFYTARLRFVFGAGRIL